MTDELTNSGLTVDQREAIRAYCDRREQEFLARIKELASMGELQQIFAREAQL